jgi:hypothetical protein
VASRRNPVLGFVFGLSALCLALPARAQLSGSVGVTSDYRLRGVSLTDRRPALTLGAVYDQASGAYVGGTAILADTPGGGLEVIGHIANLGISRRGPGGTSWDLGVSDTNVDIRLDKSYPIEYNDIYFGVAQKDISARVSYSPNYLHSGASSLYADLSGVYRPAENWRLSGHVGYLRRLSGADQVPLRRRVDLLLSATREFEHGELRLAWAAAYAKPHPHPSPGRGGLVVGASLFF